MNIYVVTGGFGFLGTEIVKEILRNESLCRVKIVSRTKDEKSVLLKDSRVEFIQSDLTNETKFDFLKHATFVIHNAGLVSFKNSERDKIFALNVKATIRIAKACEEYHIKRLAYVSSISAISIPKDKGKFADETLFNDPEDKFLNLYTQSKTLAEIELHKIIKELDYVVACPSVILGSNDKKIASLIRLLRKTPVILSTDPIQSVVDVRDCARAIYFLLQKGETRNRYIITSNHIKLTDMIRQLLAAMNKRTLVLTIPKWLLSPLKPFAPAAITSAITDKLFSNKKLLDLGFKFNYTIEQTITDMINNTK